MRMCSYQLTGHTSTCPQCLDHLVPFLIYLPKLLARNNRVLIIALHSGVSDKVKYKSDPSTPLHILNAPTQRCGGFESHGISSVLCYIEMYIFP